MFWQGLISVGSVWILIAGVDVLLVAWIAGVSGAMIERVLGALPQPPVLRGCRNTP